MQADRPFGGIYYPGSLGEFQAWFATDADLPTGEDAYSGPHQRVPEQAPKSRHHATTPLNRYAQLG